jgi:hypothetical protein
MYASINLPDVVGSSVEVQPLLTADNTRVTADSEIATADSERASSDAGDSSAPAEPPGFVAGTGAASGRSAANGVAAEADPLTLSAPDRPLPDGGQDGRVFEASIEEVAQAEDYLVSDGNSPPTYIGRRRRDGWPGDGDPAENGGPRSPGSPQVGGEATSPDEPPLPGRLLAEAGDYSVTGADVRMSAPRAALGRPAVPSEGGQGTDDEGELPPGSQLYDNPPRRRPSIVGPEAAHTPIIGNVGASEAPDAAYIQGEGGPGAYHGNHNVAVQIGSLTAAVENAEIPPQRPAAVVPVWRGGRLVVPDQPAPADLPEDTLTAVLQVAREDFAQTVAHLQAHPGNASPSLIDHAARVLDLIPTARPDQVQIFRSGRAVERLSAVVEVDETLGTENKVRLIDELQHLQKVHDQFPAWREFRRNARAASLTADQLREVPELLHAVISTLRTPEAAEFVDVSVPDAYAALEAPGDVPFVLQIQGTDLVAFDILESVLNLLGQLAEPAKKLAVRAVKDQAGAFWKGSLKGTETIGEHVTLQAWGLFGALVSTAAVGHFPMWFIWAPSVLTLLGNAINAAVASQTKGD